MNGTDPGPKPLDEEIDAFGATDTGLVREENQDHFVLVSLRKQLALHGTSLTDLDRLPWHGDRMATLAAVADGLGGHEAGETASRTAVETLVRYVTLSLNCYYTADPASERAFLRELRGAALRCHESVLAEATDTGETMAPTLTLALFHWPQVYIVQAGDSRFYRLRDGELQQLTRDQTLAQDLIDEGMPGAAPRFKNVLTSALGGPTITPVVTHDRMQRSDVVLLCSDGLAGVVPDETIRRRLLEMESAEQVTRTLVDDTLAAGGPDNVTVAVARFVGSDLPLPQGREPIRFERRAAVA